jgi:hypothetical protein
MVRYCKHFAAPTLTDRLMINHWAGVSRNRTELFKDLRQIKREKDILYITHSPKHNPIICHLPDPPPFSLPTIFKHFLLMNILTVFSNIDLF